MFEGIVADFLSRYLGQYIDGFDPKQLKIGIWKGQIEYHNIKLRADVLNSFSLPVSIKDGAVRSLYLSIPWHNLKGGNIEITLDGIYLLARPAVVAESESAEEEQQRELFNKQARLMRAEMLKAAKLQPKPAKKGQRGDGILLRLLTKVVDRVQITVRNVHLRYEDHVTNPTRGFSVGVTLEQLSLHSTPPTAMSAVYQRLIHKVLTVRNLAVYWTSDPPVQYTSVSELIHVMDQFIARGNQAISARPVQYILAPVTCHVQLQVNPSDHVTSAQDVPKIDARIRLEPIHVSVSEAQYSDAMCLLTALSNHATRVKHARLRPRTTPHDNPRAWWSYLATLLLAQVRARKYRWSGEYFTERRRHRLEYIKLHKRYLHKTLSLNGRARLDHLEQVLSYDDILLFRAWAELELKREGRAVVPKSGYVASVTSWAKSWFKRNNAHGTDEDEDAESRVEISEEMRKEFLETIEYQPSTAPVSRDQLPADWIDARVEFTMPLLDLQLSHVTGPVCVVALRDLTVRMNHRARGVQLHAELGAVEASSLLDHTRVTPLMRMLESAPLLSCHVESNRNQYDLTLLLSPIEVRVDKEILHALAAVFTRHHTPSIQRVEIAAKYQLKRIGRRTRRHVERQMKQASTLSVQCDVDVTLPRIVVAHGTEHGAHCELTVDLGHIRATHNDEPSTRNVTSANEFSVVWDDIQVTAVTAAHSDQAPHSHTVLQPLSVTADILLGTLASAAQARVKARSSVSQVSVRVTPELVHQLVPLMQDLLPAPSVNEIADSVNGGALEGETVLQTDENILRLYDVVDADQSASEDEDELSEERAIDKSEYELIKTVECTIDLAGAEIQLRDDKSPRNLRLHLGPVMLGLLMREGELTANLLLREVRVSDGQHGDWLHTQGHPDWLTAHVRVIDAVSPRYNGVAHIVKLSVGTLNLCIVPPSITNALNLVTAFAPSTPPRDIPPAVPVQQSRASPASELSSKILLHLSGVVIQALDAVRVPVTTITLHDVTAQLDLKAEYRRVKGYIGNLRVMDCTSPEPRAVLTKSRDDLTWVDFNLIHLRNPRELANPLIRAHVKQLSVTARLEYVTALLHYAAQITAALPVMAHTSRAATVTLPPAPQPAVKYQVPRHLPKYHVILEAPELVVLVHGEERHVIGQLVLTGGDLLLFNTSRWIDGHAKSRDLLDTINITWTGCHLAYQPLLLDSGTHHLLANLAVVAAVERVYSRHVLATPHLAARCTVSPVIFAVNQQMCDVFTTLFSEWARHQSRAPISPATPSASANIPPIVAADSTPSRTPVTESHVSLYVHLEELAVKLEGANQCVTTCAVQHVTARVSVDHDARQAEVHTRVRAGVETIQITAQQRHAEELVLLGPASHVTVLGRRADHLIAHEPLIQMDVHRSQSALLDRLELRVKVMPLRAVCLIDTLTRVVNSVTPILNLTSALTPVTSNASSIPSETVTRVNTVPVSHIVSTRDVEVVVKELEVTVPEHTEAINSSSVKVLSFKTDLLASLQLNATGTHVYALLQHTDLALLDLLNKQGNFDVQRSQLLDPFELVVTAQLTAHESRAEVTAQPLLLRISFMDLVLINQLATAFTTAPFVAQLAQSQPRTTSPAHDTKSASSTASSGVELTVALSNVQLTVIDDSLIGQTFSLPLIEFSLNPVSLNLALHGDMKVTARVGVQCNFFNPQSMQWESLLHPLTTVLTLAQHPHRTTAHCRIADPVVLAVSQPLVQVASRASEVLASLFSRQFQHTARTPRSRGRAPALVLHNAVGRAIKWGHSSAVHELKDQSQVTLAKTGSHDTHITLALQVTPFKPYHAVPVLTNRYSAVHSALALTLSPHPKNTHRVKLLWEDWHDYAADLHYSLSRRGGMLTVDSENSSAESVTRDTTRMTRVKRLRTGIRITNGLPSSTAVGYTPAAVYLTSAKHGTVSRTLAPLADWPVPLDLLLQDDTRISITLQHNLVNNAADLERRGRRRERGPVSVSEDSTVSDSEHEDEGGERHLDVDLEAEVDDEGSLSLWELLTVIQEARRQRTARESEETDEHVLSLTPHSGPAPRGERTALMEPDELDHVPVSVYISVPQCVLQLTAFSENNLAVVVQPHVIVENLLPGLMWFKLRDARTHTELVEQCVNRGELVPIFCTSATMRQLQLSVKLEGYAWSTWATINNTRAPDQALTLLDDQQRALHLALDYAVSGTRTVSVYSKYWLINRTALPIQYRAANVEHVTAGLRSIDTALNTDPQLDPKLWYRALDRGALNQLVLYSGLDATQSKNRLQVQVSDSQWSQELNIDTVGWSGAIELAGHSTHSYTLVTSIQLATPSKYFRTKVVTFAPRYVLVNHTGHVLYYRQEHTAHVYSLAPYEQLPFHPLSTAHAQSCKLSITPRPDEWLWSGNFAVDKLGELSVNIRDSNNQIKRLMRVEVKVAHGTNFITMRAESVHNPPYRIDNHSPEHVLIYQKGHRAMAQQLTPYESQPYAWEQPSMPHVLVVELPRYSFTREVDLDQIATHECSLLTLPSTLLTPSLRTEEGKSRDSSKSRKSPLFSGALTPTRSLSRSVSRARTQRTALKLRPVVTLEGPTRVLRLTDDDVHGVPERALRRVHTEGQVPPPSPPNSQSFELEVDMHSLGMSVVTLGPKELLYVSCQRIHLALSATRLQQAVELLIDHFQVDNQLLNTDCPVVVSSLHSGPAPALDATRKPFAHISLVKSLLYTDLEYYHYCAVALQEVAVIVDETLLNELFTFVNSFSRVFESDVLAQLTKSTYPLAPSTPATSINNVNVNNTEHVMDEVVAEKKIYFEMLLINPIKLTLSFASGDPTLDGRPSLFSTVLRAAGVSLGNIDSAAIVFNALALQNPFLTRNELVTYLGQHYKALLLRQAYKLFGALEVLGSPLSLIRNVGTGVYDFFYEPAQSLVTNPKDFVKAMAKGTSSLVTKSLFGLLHSLSNISGSLSKATATLTMDSAYVRAAQTSRQPRTSYTPHELPAHLHRANRSRAPVSATSHVLNELTSGMMSVIFKPITVLLHLLHKSSTKLRNSVAVVMRDLQHGGVIMRCRPSKLGNPSTQQWHRPRHQPTLEQYRYDLMSLVLISVERGAYKDHLYHQHSLLEHALKKRNKMGQWTKKSAFKLLYVFSDRALFCITPDHHLQLNWVVYYTDMHATLIENHQFVVIIKQQWQEYTVPSKKGAYEVVEQSADGFRRIIIDFAEDTSALSPFKNTTDAMVKTTRDNMRDY